MLAVALLTAASLGAVDEPLELRLLRTTYVGAWQNTDAEQAAALANDSRASYLGHVLARAALSVTGEDRGFPEWPLERLLERTLDLVGPETHALSSPALPDFHGDHAVYTLVHAMVASGQTQQAERALAARLGTGARYDRAVALQALRNIGTPAATAALRRFMEGGDDSNLAENLLADQRFPFLFDLRDRLTLIPPDQRTREELFRIADQGCGERPTLAVYFLGFLGAAADEKQERRELKLLRRLVTLRCFMTRYFAVRALALRSGEDPSSWVGLFRKEKDAWQRAQLARIGFARHGPRFLDPALELLAEEPSQYVQWELMHGNVEKREGATFRTYWDLWDHPTLQIHLNFPADGGEMPNRHVDALLSWLETGARPQNGVVHNHLLHGVARHVAGVETRRFLRAFASRDDLTDSFWILSPLQDAGALPLLFYWQTLDTPEVSQRDALERVVVRLGERGPGVSVDAGCCQPTRDCLNSWVDRSPALAFSKIETEADAQAWLQGTPLAAREPTIDFLDDLARVAEVSWGTSERERWEHLFGCWRRIEEGTAEIH